MVAHLLKRLIWMCWARPRGQSSRCTTLCCKEQRLDASSDTGLTIAVCVQGGIQVRRVPVRLQELQLALVVQIRVRQRCTRPDVSLEGVAIPLSVAVRPARDEAVSQWTLHASEHELSELTGYASF